MDGADWVRAQNELFEWNCKVEITRFNSFNIVKTQIDSIQPFKESNFYRNSVQLIRFQLQITQLTYLLMIKFVSNIIG